MTETLLLTRRGLRVTDPPAPETRRVLSENCWTPPSARPPEEGRGMARMETLVRMLARMSTFGLEVAGFELGS